jgi:hypothetical protein
LEVRVIPYWHMRKLYFSTWFLLPLSVLFSLTYWTLLLRVTKFIYCIVNSLSATFTTCCFPLMTFFSHRVTPDPDYVNWLCNINLPALNFCSSSINKWETIAIMTAELNNYDFFLFFHHKHPYEVLWLFWSFKAELKLKEITVSS